MSNVLLLLAGLSLVLFLTLVPRRILPALVIVLVVLLPLGYMDVARSVGRYFSPASIVVVVWLLRLMLSKNGLNNYFNPRGKLWFSISALPIVLLLALSLLTSQSISVSISWTLVVLVCVVLPFWLGRMRPDPIEQIVETTFLWVGIFLGALALSDFLFGFNPWTSFFSAEVNERAWSVFRTRTSLGHPLVTSTVAGVSAMAALFGRTSRPVFRSLSLFGSASALVLAVSRSGVLAAAVGLAVGCIALLIGRRDIGRARRGSIVFLLIAGLTFVIAITNSPLLTERNSSTGGISSSQYRSDSTEIARTLIQENWLLGTGPGTSASVFSAVTDGPLENSLLQVYLSLGIPLASLILITLLVVLFQLIRIREAWLASTLVYFAVSVVGFSLIDVNPALLAILSPIVFLAGQSLGGDMNKSPYRNDSISSTQTVQKSVSG